MGIKVPQSPFLPCKTPLGDKYREKLKDPSTFFTPAQLISHCALQEGYLPTMVVDLTFTDRYYDFNDLISRGVHYCKLPIAGHNRAPSRDVVSRFIHQVDEHLLSHPLGSGNGNGEDGKNHEMSSAHSNSSDIAFVKKKHKRSHFQPLIASGSRQPLVVVHCTHGMNRTGFLICSWLVERAHMSVADAIALFATVREPGIFERSYIQELFWRYRNVRGSVRVGKETNATSSPVKNEQVTGRHYNRDISSAMQQQIISLCPDAPWWSSEARRRREEDKDTTESGEE